MIHKVCSKCHKILNIQYFTHDFKKNDTYKSACNACNSMIERQWYQKNLEKCRQKVKNSYHQRRQRLQNQEEKVSISFISQRLWAASHYANNKVQLLTLSQRLKLAKRLYEKFVAYPYCIYTGEKLFIGQNAHLDHKIPLNQDLSLIYDLDNLQWISQQSNWSKNKMNHDQFVHFCHTVTQHISQKIN